MTMATNKWCYACTTPTMLNASDTTATTTTSSATTRAASTRATSSATTFKNNSTVIFYLSRTRKNSFASKRFIKTTSGPSSDTWTVQLHRKSLQFEKKLVLKTRKRSRTPFFKTVKPSLAIGPGLSGQVVVTSVWRPANQDCAVLLLQNCFQH